MGDDGEKSAAQFEALEKGEASPEKEPIKARTPLSNATLIISEEKKSISN